MKKYLPVGTNVEIIYHGNDKYKRNLAEVFVNGESIAKTMLKNGYGWVYRGGIEPSNYRELLEIENSLKNSNIGLWASHTCGGERKKATETSISTLSTNTNTTSNTTTNTTNNNSQNFPQKTSYKSQNGKDCGDMIKGNINSSWEKIYHSKWQRDYEKTEAEYCFATSFEAEQAGYRAAKR